MNPQYIVLTVVNVITPGNKPGLASINVINPPLRKLMPLPLEGNAEQGPPADRARFEFQAPPLTIRCLETFDDVVKAINSAKDTGAAVAFPVNRLGIEAAAHVGLAETIMGKDAVEKSLQAAKTAGAVRWDEAMPMVKQDHVGDLRIIPAMTEPGFQVQQCVPVKVGDQDGTGWDFESVPRELRRMFSTESEARLAIRTAGYGRKLVEGA